MKDILGRSGDTNYAPATALHTRGEGCRTENEDLL